MKNVSEEEIARIISRWTGIPVAKLTESERNKTLHLDEELHKRVIGQDEGVTKVTEAIIRSKAGIKDPSKADRIVLILRTDRCWQDRALQRRLQQVSSMMSRIWCVLI